MQHKLDTGLKISRNSGKDFFIQGLRLELNVTLRVDSLSLSAYRSKEWKYRIIISAMPALFDSLSRITKYNVVSFHLLGFKKRLFTTVLKQYRSIGINNLQE